MEHLNTPISENGRHNPPEPCLPHDTQTLTFGDIVLADEVEAAVMAEVMANGGHMLNQDHILDITKEVALQREQREKDKVNPIGYEPLPPSHQSVNHGCY